MCVSTPEKWMVTQQMTSFVNWKELDVVMLLSVYIVKIYHNETNLLNYHSHFVGLKPSAWAALIWAHGPHEMAAIWVL